MGMGILVPSGQLVQFCDREEQHLRVKLQQDIWVFLEMDHQTIGLRAFGVPPF